MKRSLRYSVFVFLFILLNSKSSRAQNHIIHGFAPIESTTFTFEDYDSLHHYFLPPSTVVIDTSHAHLWVIGNTVKPFFSVDDTTKSIMTDTLNAYPLNANDWFTLIIHPFGNNLIVYFNHKYQTTQGQDGGIVEYSFNGGANWENAKGSCNIDDNASFQGILTDNFYGQSDTLKSGAQAFSGSSNGWELSGLQFYLGAAPKPGRNTCTPTDSILVRFRFVSDSIADTLDGWIIDNIQVRQETYPGGKVNNVAGTEKLKIFPTPTQDGTINFPLLTNENDLRISVYNSTGTKIIETAYQNQLKLDRYPPGIYFYIVSGGNDYYSGRLILK